MVLELMVMVNLERRDPPLVLVPQPPQLLVFHS